jgi:peptide chain release factor 2
LTSLTRQQKIAEEQTTFAKSRFLGDNKRATEILKNIKLNEYWVNLYEQVNTAVEDFAVLYDFWKAGDATKKKPRWRMKSCAIDR